MPSSMATQQCLNSLGECLSCQPLGFGYPSNPGRKVTIDRIKVAPIEPNKSILIALARSLHPPLLFSQPHFVLLIETIWPYIVCLHNVTPRWLLPPPHLCSPMRET